MGLCDDPSLGTQLSLVCNDGGPTEDPLFLLSTLCALPAVGPVLTSLGLCGDDPVGSLNPTRTVNDVLAQVTRGQDPGPAPVTLSFARANGVMTLSEGAAATEALVVSRQKTTSAPQAFTLSFVAGNYVLVTRTFTIPGGEPSVTVSLQLVDDQADRANLFTSVTAQCPGCTVSGPLVGFTLVDNDVPDLRVTVLGGVTSLNEGSTVSVSVARANGVSGTAINFAFALTGSASVADSTLSGLLQLGPTQSSVQLLLTNVEDSLDEDVQTVVLRLATSSAYTATSLSPTVNLQDNDIVTFSIRAPQPTVGFAVDAADLQVVAQGASERTISVIGGSDGVFTGPSGATRSTDSTDYEIPAFETGCECALFAPGASSVNLPVIITNNYNVGTLSIVGKILGVSESGAGALRTTTALLTVTQNVVPHSWRLDADAYVGGAGWNNNAGTPLTAGNYDGNLAAIGGDLAKTNVASTAIRVSLTDLPTEASQSVIKSLVARAYERNLATSNARMDARTAINGGSFSTTVQGPAGTSTFSNATYNLLPLRTWTFGDINGIQVELTSKGTGGSAQNGARWFVDNLDVIVGLNERPTLVFGEDGTTYTTDENVLVPLINVTTADVNGDLASIIVGAIPATSTGVLLDGGVTVSAAGHTVTGVLQFRPAQDFPRLPEGQNGFATFSLRARDSQGDSSPLSTFTVQVTAVNTAPVAQDVVPEGGVQVPENAVDFALTLPVTDADGNAVEVVIIDSSFLEVTGSSGSTTATAFITPQEDYWGDAGFLYQACDQDTCSGVQFVQVYVTPANTPPTIELDGTLTQVEDATVANVLTISVSDAEFETPADQLLLTVRDSTGSLLLDAGNFAFGGSGETRTLVITPDANKFGSATITLQVEDSGARGDGVDTTVSLLTFVYTVTPVDDAVTFTGFRPIISGTTGSVHAIQGGYEVNGFVDDQDDLTVSALTRDDDAGEGTDFAWTVLVADGCDDIGTVTLSGADSRTVSFAIPVLDEDQATLCLLVTATGQDDGLTATTRLEIPLSHVNQAPSVAGSSTSADEETRVTLSAGATDPESDTLTYQWTSIGSGTPQAVTGATSQTLSFVLPQVAGNSPSQSIAKRVVYRLTVNDGHGNSRQALFTVTPQNVNQAPTVSVNAVTLSVVEGRTGTFSVVGNDADVGDSVSFTYLWTSDVSGLGGSTRTIQTFTAPLVEGSLEASANVPGVATRTVLVQVDDSHGGISTVTATLLVSNLNQAPTGTISSAPTVSELATLALSAAELADADFDATLTVNWIVPAGAGTLSAATGTSTVFTAPETATSAGRTVTIQMVIRDEFGGITTVSKAIAVQNVNQAPSANPSYTGGNERTTVTLKAGASDPDEASTSLQYAWTQTDGTTVTLSSASAANPTFLAPSVGAQGEVLTFSVTVTDTNGASTVASVAVSIRDTDNPRPTITAVSPASFASATNENVPVTLSYRIATGGDAVTHTATLVQVSGPAVTLHNAQTVCACTSTASAASFTASVTFNAPVVSSNAPVTLAFDLSVDDSLITQTQRVTVTVNNVNVAPSGILVTPSTVDEDSGTNSLQVTAVDVDGDNVVAQVVIPASRGTAVAGACATSGSAISCDLSYRPTQANYYGTDSFVLRLNDGFGGITQATVSINIAAVNDAPVFSATQSSRNVAEDGTLTFVLQATDVDDATLAYTIVSAPTHGFASVSSSGQVVYTPLADYTGADAFTVRASDGVNNADHLVNVAVTSVNDVPYFTPGTVSFSFVEDQSTGYNGAWATGICAGGSPACSEGTAVTFLVSTQNGGLFSGTPVVDASGNLAFTIAANANTVLGAARILVTPRDAEGLTGAQTVITVSVTAVNDRPDFVKGADLTVARTQGAYSQPFVVSTDMGPADEDASQTVLAYYVSNNNPSLFTVQPRITPAGVLEFQTDPASSGGTALLAVRLQDNGGVANGGIDTSFARAVRITVS